MENTKGNKHRVGTRIEIEMEEDPRLKNCSLTLLGSMKKLLSASIESCLDRSQYNYNYGVDNELEYVMERLGLEADEAVLLSILCEKGSRNLVSLDDLGKHLGLGTLEMLERKPSIDTLVKRGLVGEGRDEKYFVPGEVLKALRRNEVYEVEIKRCHTDESLWLELLRQFTFRCENRIAKGVFYDTVNGLLDKNSELRFAKMADRYRRELKEEEFLFLMAVGLLWVAKGQRWMPFHHVADMLRDRETTNRLLSTLRSGSSRLIKDKLIAPSTEDNAIERNGFALAENGRREFRPEGLQPQENTFCQQELTAPETIVKRTLYYNAGTARQVEELALLLGEKKMQNVLRRLRRSGLRCGFTCLFHGGPGTGKTETVMQLARRSGRAVWQVDYSQLRNKWVGDSEKSVKAAFDNYRALLSKGSPAPILLLNEADALIGKRLESPERAVDKMENAIQNIVLQEMETFEGILIATTNFTTVLDKAFERRFLYKVEFEAPDADTRSKIWRSLMPTLDSGEAFDLAEQFPAFAGGQIENITRKATVMRVLHGRNAGWDELLEMCGQEMLDSRTGHQIGFRPQAR